MCIIHKNSNSLSWKKMERSEKIYIVWSTDTFRRWCLTRVGIWHLYDTCTTHVGIVEQISEKSNKFHQFFFFLSLFRHSLNSVWHSYDTYTVSKCPYHIISCHNGRARVYVSKKKSIMFDVPCKYFIISLVFIRGAI
jgi:hypothetical protein